jgi:hypothetical protein
MSASSSSTLTLSWPHGLVITAGADRSQMPMMNAVPAFTGAAIQQRLSVPVRLFYDFLMEEGLRESNPVGRSRYTPGRLRGSRQRGLVQGLTRLPWIPIEQECLAILAVAARERSCARCALTTWTRRAACCRGRARVSPGGVHPGVRRPAGRADSPRQPPTVLARGGVRHHRGQRVRQAGSLPAPTSRPPLPSPGSPRPRHSSSSPKPTRRSAAGTGTPCRPATPNRSALATTPSTSAANSTAPPPRYLKPPGSPMSPRTSAT